jgi:hypothetical protein
MGLATGAVLGVLAALGPRTQGSFEPTQRAPDDGLRHVRIEESPGSVLEASGSRLVRIRGGRVSTIGCTDPAGPGEIRDLALDPAGNTFVAAGRGIFLLGLDVDALDPVELGEGAPRGSPTSVFVDARRRVWIGTDRSFGAIDPSFFWGRTIGPADGLSLPGPYRVRGEEEGALLLETSQGLLRYRPDLEPAPRVTEVRLGGAPCEAGATYHMLLGDPPRLSAAGTANGGATFRWRLDGHHIWRDLESEPLDPALAPGAHVLEVIALDRDLNRSAPCRVALSADVPLRYQARFLASVAGFAALLCLAIGVARSPRRADGRRAWPRGLVGGLIAAALLGQVAAGLFPHAKAWPFVGFSMYAETHAEGGITYDEGLVGLDARGNRRWIDEISLGNDSDNRWQVLGSILAGGAPVASGWLVRWNRIHPEAPLTGLQVTARRRRLTRDGPIPIAPLVFGSYGVGTSGAPR